MMKRLLAAAWIIFGASVPGLAQNNFPTPGGATAGGSVDMCLNGSNQAVPCSITNPLPVSATVSASVSGFAPSGLYATLTATNVSASVALPAGAQVAVYNTGSSAVSCKLGVGSAVATANQDQIPPGGGIGYAVGANTFIACIDQTGSASNLVVISGGTGLFTNFWGGTVSLGANQTVNVAQVNGVTTLAGTGAVGAGAQRIAVGTDTATIAGSAPGTAGTASANVLTVQGIASMTPLLVTLGAETTKVIGTVNQGTSPWVTSVTTWGGGALGAMANYGTSPGAVLVPGVNASITASVGIVAQGSTTASQLGVMNQAAVTTAAPTYTTAQTSPLSLDTHGGLRIGGAGYPAGAVPITASATGTTAATTATLATSASVTTYICGFSIRANATAAATANSTVTGTITGTLNFTQWTAPAASGLGITEMIFSPCIPASAVNTSVAVVSAAPGTGGVVSVAAWGFQL